MNYRIEKVGKQWIVLELLSNNVVVKDTVKREAQRKVRLIEKSFDGFTPEFILRKVA